MRHYIILTSLLFVPACAAAAPAAAPKCPPEAAAAATTASSAAPSSYAAPALDPALAPYGFLLGRWEAPSSAAGSGTFSFDAEVQGHVIVRHNTSNSPKGRHDDMLMMYVTPQGGVKALYADNEGHIIDYSVTASDNPKRAVFVSSEIQGAPRFRLSYALEGDSSVNGKFEMAPPGGSEFKPYLEWSAKKQ